VAGLDGVRALAVLGIVAFHSGLNSLPGGYYGVDAFFVLSGYLITSLLLGEWGATGRIVLARFWARRARRLLPALFALVAVMGLLMVAMPRLLATPHMLGDALAALFYASNWYSIHGGVSYFSTAAAPSPLLHTWSLAIEEQFYLLWPLVVLGVLTVGTQRRSRLGLRLRAATGVRTSGPGRVRTVRTADGGFETIHPAAPAPVISPAVVRRRRLRVLFFLSAGGAVASALWMSHLAPAGYTARAYYGTDTRAQGLLIGAAIAVALVLWRDRLTGDGDGDGAGAGMRVRQAGTVLGLVGLVGSGVLWATTAETSRLAFSGGFLLAGLFAGMVVFGAVVAPKGPAVRLLELPPLPGLGRISYGVYLWYWPVLLVMSGARLHWGVYPLFVARVGVTVVLATLSAHFIEEPIRRGALPSWRALAAAPAAVAATIGLVVAGTLVPMGASALEGSTVVGPPAATGTSGVGAGHNALTDLATPDADPEPGSATASGSALATPPTSSSPVKVLLVGDSIAGSLGAGLSRYAANDNVQIANEGIPGCSLSMTGTEIKVLFYTLPPDQPCGSGSGATSMSSTNPGPLLDQWRQWVDAYNPDVVVYVARGETFDQQDAGGQWGHVGERAFDAALENRYRQAISVLGSRGAAVVLLTTPYFDSGSSPSGASWPEDAPGRAALDNQLIREAAGVGGGSVVAGAGASSILQGDGHPAYVFDLSRLISPANAYAPAVDGVSVRCGDGVHFTPSGGEFVGLQLLPVLAQLGQTHHGASPSGAWPGHLPPSTPSWYAKLPC
jgi:peptidoglycan/LPS O-acetylase OafA/YrhL